MGKQRKKDSSPSGTSPHPGGDPVKVLESWDSRFAQLARLQTYHPLHETLEQYYPCPICAGDVQGFFSHFKACRDWLAEPVRYAGKKADCLMVLLFWHWTAMHGLRKEEESLKPVRIPPMPKEPLPPGGIQETLKPLGLSALRVRAHRARKRGTVHSYKVWSVARPFFTGTIAIKESKNVTISGSPGAITVKTPPPPKQKGGRPGTSEEPSRLVCVAAATLLHKWFPRRPSRRQFTYLSWALITNLLKEFTPPGSSFGFQGPASVRRKVSAYRKNSSLQKFVASLDSTLIPSILRSFGRR